MTEVTVPRDLSNRPAPSGKRLAWKLAAALLMVVLIPTLIWMQGDVVDASVCRDRPNAIFTDGRSPVGTVSWVSAGLPAAKVRGVRIRSYRVVGTGLQDGNVTIKVADHHRWAKGKPTGIDFRVGAYVNNLDDYFPSISAFLEDPVGVPLRVLPPGPRGMNFDNVALFVGATRHTTGPMSVDHIKITFRSGLRSQTCAVPVALRMVAPETVE
jgi:hypothetical protein